LYHPAADDKDLEIIVRKLQDKLGELREDWQEWLRQDAAHKAETAAQLAELNRITSGRITSAKIRVQLLATVTETHERELAQAEAASDWQERQRLREAAEAAHTVRLSRIDELAATFAEIEGRGGQRVQGTHPHPRRTRRGSGHRLCRRATPGHPACRPPRAAALHQSKGQPEAAAGLYADILNLEPDWPTALHDCLWFRIEQGDDARIHQTQAQARQHYLAAQGHALRLTELEPDTLQWRRNLSVAHDRLGDVAVAQGRLDEAAQAYRAGLAICEALATAEPGNTEWRRDLYVSHVMLGEVASRKAGWTTRRRLTAPVSPSARRRPPPTPAICNGSAMCTFRIGDWPLSPSTSNRRLRPWRIGGKPMSGWRR
jgi:tetratricopeptide (TPR) repeat protein